MLITDDNSARWGWSFLYSFVGELQVVGDNYDRWGSLLFSYSIYAHKWQNIILGHFRTVIGELCGSCREKVLKLKYIIETWLKIFKNQYHEK